MRMDFAPPDEQLAAEFLKSGAGASERARAEAIRLIEAIRASTHLVPDVEAVLHAYSL
jgi:hypothetical protein